MRRDVWHAADIFASPSDNIQETFGLTPVEAMAAGLPCVVSDWNGYRDTLRHGEEGFLVPTWLAPEGTGEDLARRFHQQVDDYDRYIGQASQFAAVDVIAMTAAFDALIANDELHRQMGEKARKRALSHYDWPVVIKQYEALWAELAQRRTKEAESALPMPGAPAVPLHDDPFRLFAGYPSHNLGPDTRVRLAPGADVAVLKRLSLLGMNVFAQGLMPAREVQTATLETLAQDGERRAADLASELAPPGQEQAYQRGLVWLAKLGLVQLENPNS